MIDEKFRNFAYKVSPKGLLNNEDLEARMLSILNFNEKFILTGSATLIMLGLLDKDYKYIKDLDICCSEPLTDEEYTLFKDFFGFEESDNISSDGSRLDDSENWLNCKTQRLDHFIPDNNTFDFSVDLFLSPNWGPNDIIVADYNGYLIKILKPNITLAYKTKYMFSSSGSSSLKHTRDMLKCISRINDDDIRQQRGWNKWTIGFALKKTMKSPKVDNQDNIFDTDLEDLPF